MENNELAAEIDIIDDKPDVVKTDLRKFNKTEAKVTTALADQVGVEQAMESMKNAKKVETAIENKRKELVKPYNDVVARINEYAKGLTGKIPPAIQKVKDEILAFHKREEKRLNDLRTNAREKQLIELGYTRHVEGTDFVKGDVYVNNDQYILRISVENHTDDMWAGMLQTMATQLEKKKQEQIAALQQEKQGADFFGDDGEKKAIDEKIEQLQTQPINIPTSHVPAFGSSKVKGLTKRWTFEIQDAGMVPREYLQVDEKKIREAIAAGERNIPGVRIYQDESITLR